MSLKFFYNFNMPLKFNSDFKLKIKNMNKYKDLWQKLQLFGR